MTVNTRFIAMLMAEEDVDFATEFAKLPEEQQDEFFEAYVAVIMWGISLMRTAPTDIKVATIANQIAVLPREYTQMMADFLINGVPEF